MEVSCPSVTFNTPGYARPGVPLPDTTPQRASITNRAPTPARARASCGHVVRGQVLVAQGEGDVLRAEIAGLQLRLEESAREVLAVGREWVSE
jgi:hypothetical protein